ncbi:TetR family transcriptional regulator [Agromyces ramosus]|uniref:TetR family transcriptional regulator n=1 Tax=Agromyces ramosus TaxID=33879 RepID=A0A4Q7M841_9MICO|nr:TetR family transcriptional regulator [Agromyces ramosus]RZS64196.1 TetR family transcriptional regulator [Agromyces ramosus]
MADRRTTLADAALAIVADHGFKGLTHRAVDREASVPPGTTSNYFRTRVALIGAVVDRVEQRDLEVWAAGDGTPATTPEGLAGQLASYLGVLARSHADLARTRFSLSIERPDDVAEGHRRFLALAERSIGAIGLGDAALRARWVADYCDGVLLHQVTARRDEVLDVAAITAAIRRLLD